MIEQGAKMPTDLEQLPCCPNCLETGCGWLEVYFNTQDAQPSDCTATFVGFDIESVGDALTHYNTRFDFPVHDEVEVDGKAAGHAVDSAMRTYLTNHPLTPIGDYSQVELRGGWHPTKAEREMLASHGRLLPETPTDLEPATLCLAQGCEGEARAFSGLCRTCEGSI